MLRIFVDMDDTICAYKEHLAEMRGLTGLEFPQGQPGFFLGIPPIPGAIESLRRLDTTGHDVWILTRPSYMNPHCFTEKALWVRRYLGEAFYERLILCGDKSLVKGDVLVDDAGNAGQEGFEGEWIRYDSEPYFTWASVEDRVNAIYKRD